MPSTTPTRNGSQRLPESEDSSLSSAQRRVVEGVAISRGRNTISRDDAGKTISTASHQPDRIVILVVASPRRQAAAHLAQSLEGIQSFPSTTSMPIVLSERTLPKDITESAAAVTEVTKSDVHEDNYTSGLRPFFILVEDTASAEAIHPEVHYIFSDDDPEILTAATLDAADPDFAFDPNHGDIEQRVVIVDMAADARTVSKISSLSPFWQISTAEVDYAPSWHGNTEESEKNILLKLFGTSAHAVSEPPMATSASLQDLVAMLDHELKDLEAQMATYGDDNIVDQTASIEFDRPTAA